MDALTSAMAFEIIPTVFSIAMSVGMIPSPPLASQHLRAISRRVGQADVSWREWLWSDVPTQLWLIRRSEAHFTFSPDCHCTHLKEAGEGSLMTTSEILL